MKIQLLKFTIPFTLLLVGCTSSRPYTPVERTALVHALIGQSVDVVTTDMAMSDERFEEGNPIWWNPEDSGSMLASKFIIVGVGYLIGEVKPNWRTPIYYSIGGAGYAAGAWNTYQMIEHDVSPWKK